MGFYQRELARPAPAAGLAVEWEEVPCLLCGRRQWRVLVEAPDPLPGGDGLWFAVVQCQDCGLCFTNPRPSPRSIGRFYPRAETPAPPRRCRPPSAQKWRLPGKKYWEPALHVPGRLLDLGCDTGRFLQRMHLRGWQVTGLGEAAAAERVRRETGLPVVAGALPHPALAAGSFDLIAMRNSLEHAHDPLDVLRQAHRLLAAGGRLVVTVPNIDSLPFRWFGRAWVGLDLPRHLTHFSPWTLRQMLRQAGFEVGPIHMIRRRRWLRISAERSCAARFGPHWHHWLTSRPVAGLAAWYGYLTHQADSLLVVAERGADLY